MQRTSRVALLLICAAAFGCTGGSEGPERTAEACQRLRDHVVDLRVAEIHQDREAHRAALRNALGGRFVTECLNQSSARFDCEMKATTIDGLRACASAD